ncbi:MAG: acetyl/propionyl/methylcrotonyl-CoA carboxylase subunit alpha [Betaproteobacteria bacterium]|nr:acetyl/propionyl/methylcrotonyl-CoA carboxylase subunit alpha [Betaproteobacteria bacterium]
MFRKILIANRGEIACRVAATARRLGIGVATVYSEADAGARHVKLADEAFLIGPAPAAESYLRGERVIEAAKRCGAQAIHPGYGFLSENEAFARACAAAGIVFIGPTPEAIAAMGDKSAAKRLMEKAGVPLVPGYHGEKQDPGFLAKEAQKIGFPVLIKASAGGGGKGMRIVTKAAEFQGGLEGAQREAKAAFGDAHVLIERYLERPRHIEVQVFGDTQGACVYLFERDCSVQRRHQKVLEEAPAPGMSDKRRREMGEAAVAAARAVGYVGAGTVEFIAEPEGRFYFMEMNTRLQVEHPVTEMITGLDLVEWQLRVAAGEPLPLAQKALAIRGHAIEARLYAEDPERGFLPQTGRLAHLRFPQAADAVRIDTGVEAGATISPHYDPMIAKLIAWGEDRPAALARLAAALAGVEIVGVKTNVEFLERVVRSRAFGSGDLDTGLIERSRNELFPPVQAASHELLAAAAMAELLEEADEGRARAAGSGDPYSPWDSVDGWRLNQGSHHRFVFAEHGRRHEVTLQFRSTGFGLTIDGREYALTAERTAPGSLRLQLDGRVFEARAVHVAQDWLVSAGGARVVLRLEEGLPADEDESAPGSLAAPMPGKVIALLVKPGAKVEKGAPLLILEAMKMEHTISAPADGVVKAIHFAAGEQVPEGAELLTLE